MAEPPAKPLTEEEIAKGREQAKAMDLPGVARTPDLPPEQNKKCSNRTCLQRELDDGPKFKRCAKCRQAFYCSEHCQRTHWRDGHSKECKYAPPSAAAAAFVAEIEAADAAAKAAAAAAAAKEAATAAASG